MLERVFKSMSVLAVAAAIVLAASKVQAADKGSITLTIEKIKNADGRILVCLFSQAKEFPSCKGNSAGVRAFDAKAKKGSVSLRLNQLPVGTYAISAAHDQNNDGKIETHRLFGYPTEGAGISNYPKPPFGPPRFNAAKFKLSKGTKNVSVIMHYP